MELAIWSVSHSENCGRLACPNQVRRTEWAVDSGNLGLVVGIVKRLAERPPPSATTAPTAGLSVTL